MATGTAVAGTALGAAGGGYDMKSKAKAETKSKLCQYMYMRKHPQLVSLGHSNKYYYILLQNQNQGWYEYQGTSRGHLQNQASVTAASLTTCAMAAVRKLYCHC